MLFRSAKYESLLDGSENPKDIVGGAKEIALELKAELEELHEKLKEIAAAIREIIKNDSKVIMEFGRSVRPSNWSRVLPG